MRPRSQVGFLGEPADIILHPDTAPDHGVADGQRVRVHNKSGETVLTARVDLGTRKGVCSIPLGDATGKVCVFYTNEHRVLSHDWRPVVRTGAPLWVAKYGVNDGFPHTPPRTGPWPRTTMWQYTSKKRMPGVTENTVDMNQFFGDIAQFRGLGGTGLVGASQAGLTEDQFRSIMREEATEVLDSKARRVKGIVSWERYLQVLLDAVRAPGTT